jgi:hypothetical protein
MLRDLDFDDAPGSVGHRRRSGWVVPWVSFGAGFLIGATASFLLVSPAEARRLIAERDADAAARRGSAERACA